MEELSVVVDLREYDVFSLFCVGDMLVFYLIDIVMIDVYVYMFKWYIRKYEIIYKWLVVLFFE